MFRIPLSRTLATVQFGFAARTTPAVPCSFAPTPRFVPPALASSQPPRRWLSSTPSVSMSKVEEEVAAAVATTAAPAGPVPGNPSWQQTMLRVKDPKIEVPFWECVSRVWRANHSQHRVTCFAPFAPRGVLAGPTLASSSWHALTSRRYGRAPPPCVATAAGYAVWGVRAHTCARRVGTADRRAACVRACSGSFRCTSWVLCPPASRSPRTPRLRRPSRCCGSGPVCCWS